MRWRQYEGFKSYQYCTCRHTKPFRDVAQTRYREHRLSRILLWPVTGLFLPIYRFVTWKQLRRGKWTRFRIAVFTNNFPITVTCIAKRPAKLVLSSLVSLREVSLPKAKRLWVSDAPVENWKCEWSCKVRRLWSYKAEFWDEILIKLHETFQEGKSHFKRQLPKISLLTVLNYSLSASL